MSKEEGWGCGPQGLPDVLDLGQVGALTQASSDRIVLERREEEVNLSPSCQQLVLPDTAPSASLGSQPLTLPRVLPSIQLVSGLAPCTREEGSSPTHLAQQLVDWRTSGLLGREGQEAVCRGRILLQLAGTVLLNRTQLLFRKPAINRFVCQFKTVRELQDAGKMIDLAK